MKSKVIVDAMDFETTMKEIPSSPDIEEMIYLESAFNNVTANMFKMV